MIYYFITADLILQSWEIFSPAIVLITVLGNEKTIIMLCCVMLQTET